MGRVSGTSKQLRGAREAGSVTSCLARIQDHPLGSREMLVGPALSLSADSRGHEARLPLWFVPGASSRGSGMFRHRVPRLNHRRRRSTPVNHCLAVKVKRQTMRRGGAQREFSLPRSGAERHHACRAQGPPSTGKDESEKGAARQLIKV